LKILADPDPAHLLVRRVGATVTPEAAVLDQKGRMLYRGPIDGLYFDFGKRRPAPTQSHVRQVLDAILSGKPIIMLRIKLVGCYISTDLRQGSRFEAFFTLEHRRSRSDSSRIRRSFCPGCGRPLPGDC
jgi:hypothetical protein